MTDVNIDEVWNELDEKKQREAVKEELNHPNFRKWLKGLLQVTEAEIIFFKLSGDERKMRCTLEESKIPDDKKPKQGSTRKISKDSIAVFDLDKQDWRSFRYDTIKEFAFDLPEDCEYPPHPEPVIFGDQGEFDEGAEVSLVDPNIIDVETKTIH